MVSAERRLRIWERDSHTCGLCGEPVALGDLEIDHIIPRAKGGTNDDDNLRASLTYAVKWLETAKRIDYYVVETAQPDAAKGLDWLRAGLREGTVGTC